MTSVYNIYKKYQTPRSWTEELVKTCEKAKIEFMTTPYDLEAIEMFHSLVNCFKIGSGDITYLQLLKKFLKQKNLLFCLREPLI